MHLVTFDAHDFDTDVDNKCYVGSPDRYLKLRTVVLLLCLMVAGVWIESIFAIREGKGSQRSTRQPPLDREGGSFVCCSSAVARQRPELLMQST